MSSLSPLRQRAASSPSSIWYQNTLDSKSLDLVLESTDLAHQVGSLVGGDGSGDDGAGNTASTAKSDLGGDVNVRCVLVLGQERDVQENGQRGGVGGKDNNLFCIKHC